MAKFYGKDSGYLVKEQLKFFSWSAALVVLPLAVMFIAWKTVAQFGFYPLLYFCC